MTSLGQRTEKATRICAALLLAVFLSPLLALWTSLGPADDVTLPACCRMHGRHHCSQDAALTAGQQNQPVVAQITERCLYQAAAPGLHLPNGSGSPPASFATPASADTSLRLQSQRIHTQYATSHAHPKRGPPAFSDPSQEA